MPVEDNCLFWSMANRNGPLCIVCSHGNLPSFPPALVVPVLPSVYSGVVPPSAFCNALPVPAPVSDESPKTKISITLCYSNSSLVHVHYMYIKIYMKQQSISQDLEIGHPNLLFFGKTGCPKVSLFICKCIKNKQGVHLANKVSKRHPKVCLPNTDTVTYPFVLPVCYWGRSRGRIKGEDQGGGARGGARERSMERSMERSKGRSKGRIKGEDQGGGSRGRIKGEDQGGGARERSMERSRGESRGERVGPGGAGAVRWH